MKTSCWVFYFIALKLLLSKILISSSNCVFISWGNLSSVAYLSFRMRRIDSIVKRIHNWNTKLSKHFDKPNSIMRKVMDVHANHSHPLEIGIRSETQISNQIIIIIIITHTIYVSYLAVTTDSHWLSIEWQNVHLFGSEFEIYLR